MAYETVLTIHIISFIWNISLVVFADGIGLLWVAGKLKQLPRRTMILSHRLVWLGLGTSIITGSLLFWDLRDYLLETPAFYTKILFVLALLINSFLISKHLHTALDAESFKALSKKEKYSFFISGVISTISWISVIISARLLGV